MQRFILFTIIVLFAACAPSAKEQLAEQKKAAAKNPTAYPFNVSLKTTESRIVHSSEILPQNGKPTVVMFWLTTCAPCKKELAAIKKEYPSWRDETDFNIVAISTDWEKNFQRFVERVANDGWEWEAYWDKDRGFKHVIPGELNGLPQTFVFNPEGEIVYHKKRYISGDEHKLYAEIKKAAKG